MQFWGVTRYAILRSNFLPIVVVTVSSNEARASKALVGEAERLDLAEGCLRLC